MRPAIAILFALGLGACADVDVESMGTNAFALSAPTDVIDSDAMIQNQFLDTSQELCPRGFVLDHGAKHPSDLQWDISCASPVASR
jgi:hypothetical protein